MSTLPDVDSLVIAQGWLSAFAAGIHAADAHAVAKTFQPGGWLRDVLTFTWDIRSLEGRDKIIKFLIDKLAAAKISRIALSENVHLRPKPFSLGVLKGFEFGYTYETAIAHGQGFVRLVHEEGEGWLAHTACTIITDLRGHEEPTGRYDFEDFVGGLTWGEYTAQQRATWEADPHVVIIGGGQLGLQIAARFKQMRIPSIVVERNERIGDNWRKRYDSLMLHTVKEQSQLLYQPHPSNWPVYPPRDRIANMLETYAMTQELFTWTNSYPSGRPIYDHEKQRWKLPISRNGHEVILHPAHIVLATGTLGDPYTLELANRDAFTGEVLHSSRFRSAAPYKGRKVIVVGAGNSSIDICQDLALAGAASVTMIQRSPTCVADRNAEGVHLQKLFTDEIPMNINDLKFQSTSKGYIAKMAMTEAEKQYYFGTMNKDVIAKAQKGGVMVDFEKPQCVLWFERLGGYWWDKGGADLIASGAIKVKTRVSPVSYTERGVFFSDDTELPADAVIFATGYINMREVNKQIFGAEVIDRTKEVWGLDSEGEVNGCYRPSGYPGLWYAAGEFVDGRFQSKQLAIMIKAIELGLMKQA